MAADHTRLSNEESAAFDRWRETVRTAGTQQRRDEAWARYTTALDRLCKATAALPRTNMAKAA